MEGIIAGRVVVATCIKMTKYEGGIMVDCEVGGICSQGRFCCSQARGRGWWGEGGGEGQQPVSWRD